MRCDPRVTHLAENLIHYSVALKKGETLYIDLIGSDCLELGKELIRIATGIGAIPYWNCFDDSLSKPFFRQAGEAQFAAFSQLHQEIMARADAYIGVRGQSNPYDLGDMPAEQRNWRQKIYFQKVHMETRMKKRWVVMRYPTPSMATLSKMSQSAFEDFYFDVCTLDYRKMSQAMDPLVKLMEKTDEVRIVSPGTDIRFSIRGIPVIKCDGRINIPDGEVFTAPVRDSVNGTIQYNTTSFHDGLLFRDIRLTVKNGRIEEFSAPEHGKELAAAFNLDEGARYFGEFAIGVNPYVLEPMNDTLFDEKIAGSIHLTPGNSYDEASNGNHSSLHWDLVLIQRESYGGGEIYFDGKLVRKNGKFVLPELQPLDGAIYA